MNYLLDTDTLIDLIRGVRQDRRAPASQAAHRLAKKIQSVQDAGHSVGCSAITIAELEYGAARSRNPLQERTALDKILSPFKRYDFDAVKGAFYYGEVRALVEANGVPIGAMDLLIAAHALALDAVLVTGNRAHFERIPELRLETWLASR